MGVHLSAAPLARRPAQAQTASNMNDFDSSVPVPGFDPAPATPPVGFLGEARKIAIDEALRVIPDTLGILVRSLGSYLSVALAVLLLYAVVSFVLGLLFGPIPVLDVVVLDIGLPTALWMLFYGWYRIIDTRETTGRVVYRQLLDGFTDDPLRLAGGVLAIWVGTTVALFLLATTAMVIAAPGAFTGEQDPVSAMMRGGFVFGLLTLIGTIALSPMMSVQGTYLATTAVGRITPWRALGLALRATLRNWIPITVVNALTMLAATLVALIVGVVVGGIAGLLRSSLVGMIIALPAMVLAMALMPIYGYALFKRMFYARPDDEIEEARPSRMSTVAPPPEAFAPPPVDHDAPWTLALLRALNPIRFGALCSAYFSAAGFHVEDRHGLTDGSARFVLAAMSAPERPMMFVETVAWGASVDLPRLRNFREALTRNQMARGTMVAASGFSDDAHKDAAMNKVRVIDGAELLTLILKLPADKQQALRDAAFPPPAA